MCIVSHPDDIATKTIGIIKYKDDPKGVIPPDAETPSVQSTFGRDPKQMRSTSVYNSQVIHYMMTQYSLKRGLKEFPEEGKKAVKTELEQLYDKQVFKPVHWKDLTRQDKLKVLNSIIFIKRKNSGLIKARA